MIVIRGRAGKSLLSLKYTECDDKEVLIVETEGLQMSKFVDVEGVYSLHIQDNSPKELKRVVDILTYGFDDEEDLSDIRVIFYVNTTDDMLPIFAEFEKKHGVDVVVTVQTDDNALEEVEV